MIKLCFLLLALASVATGLIGRTQSAGVRGVLMCDGRPAAGVTVKLWDDDRGIDADDLLAAGKTNSMGQFELKGHTDEAPKKIYDAGTIQLAGIYPKESRDCLH
ncbi:hypothetical protein WR25_16949 [Diploscapter pachys]|uniref:Transthyretin/hydroxyisourate hydrolase domain-containing protein n=1 Tax=Diploscapter pachys TaxID=2018661 RepID=A0A2A2KQV7_9BILA|nr:hypothetical protein WR25_16949 [Diploscapter pachys]